MPRRAVHTSNEPTLKTGLITAFETLPKLADFGLTALGRTRCTIQINPKTKVAATAMTKTKSNTNLSSVHYGRQAIRKTRKVRVKG